MYLEGEEPFSSCITSHRVPENGRDRSEVGFLLATGYSLQTLCTSFIFWPFFENDLWRDSIWDRVKVGLLYSGANNRLSQFSQGIRSQVGLA